MLAVADVFYNAHIHHKSDNAADIWMRMGKSSKSEYIPCLYSSITSSIWG